MPDVPPRRVLFVCKGNICRSPFAALRARTRFDEAGLTDIICLSAGLRASQAPAPPPFAVDAAATFGIALEHHRAADVTSGQFSGSDLIVVVMEPSQREVVRRMAPHLTERVHLLSLYEPDNGRYGARERVNLLDPFGHERETFMRCYRRIDAALSGLAVALAEATARARVDSG